MKAIINKILDIYYRIPLFIDAMIVILIWLLNSNASIFTIGITTGQITTICSSIIDTSVSMAGFILAALTIIVTFKSNIKAKGIEDSKNALEMILASSNYKSIIYTFKSSIIELTVVFFILYITTIVKGELTKNIQFNILVSTVAILILSLTRSLFLLFKILKMEK